MRLETQRDDDAQLRERCVADIREMDGLIDSVLDVLRSPHAGVPLQRIDVGALVDDIAELGQRFSGECLQAVAAVDAAALRRVIGNLIDNGLRYGMRVQVTVSRTSVAHHDRRRRRAGHPRVKARSRVLSACASKPRAAARPVASASGC